ncbi:MAG TPA: TetR/AcrR family transcriptional regulator [Myxococcota bacterium]|nr:TetR/AcrR family transcriptional regulator [Myxococcota bacterium]
MPRRAVTPRPTQRRGSGIQTRAEIVAAAERRFAEQGFEATRLEDVAADVGIRRAAIFYYFRDKLELYNAVLDEVFRSVIEILPSSGSIGERLEASLVGWIDYVARRPSVARLILREAANAQHGAQSSPFLRVGRAPVEMFLSLIKQGVASGELSPVVEPHRFISLMGATTIFHFAAMPWMTVDVSFDIWSPPELERHKREIVEIARAMLGIEPAASRNREG